MIDTIKNFIDGLLNFRLWQALSSQDIKLKYRRSTLGPLWITLSMAITVSAMGPLYGALFGVNLASFVPHLALGFIFWAFIASSMTEYAEAFTSSEHILKQSYIPLTTLIFRVFYRQLLILLHNLLIYPFIILLCGVKLNLNVFYLLPGFILISLIVIFMGLFISIFCTRFRDMIPIIQSFISLLFFVTPIIWQQSQLPPNRAFLAKLNPFSSLLNIVREPLVGVKPDIDSWYIAFLMLMIIILITFPLFHYSRKKLTYWL